jgi:hypothetical protein
MSGFGIQNLGPCAVLNVFTCFGKLFGCFLHGYLRGALAALGSVLDVKQ